MCVTDRSEVLNAVYPVFKFNLLKGASTLRVYKKMLTFEGCNFFRQRLVLSTLSGKAIKIIRIRDKDEQPGLTGRST